MSRGKHEKKSGVWLTVLTAALAAVFLVSGGMVALKLWRARQEDRAFEALVDRLPSRPSLPGPTEPVSTEPVSTEPAPSESAPTETAPAQNAGTAPAVTLPGAEQTDFELGSQDDQSLGVLTPQSVYGRLKEENPDLFGWIAIDGTKINYPVMHTPKKPEYYLRRAFDKSRSTSGTPFLDGACFVGCGNYIVYGHKMQNGTMFADLLKYAQKSFWKEHPIIHFDTTEEFGDYEVLAAFYSQVYSALDGDEVFRYYRYTDLGDEAVFNEFVEKALKASRYKTGVKAVYGDQLLTLSTCSYHVEDGRFVVVARKIPS